MFPVEYFSRYEIPLVRLSSLYALVRSQLLPQLVLSAIANDTYFSDITGARLLCCLCERATDLRELHVSVSLLLHPPTVPLRFSSPSHAFSLVEAAQALLHRPGCPACLHVSANRSNNIVGMLCIRFYVMSRI